MMFCPRPPPFPGAPPREPEAFDWWPLVAAVVIVGCLFGGIVWFVESQKADIAATREKATLAAKFGIGETVRSRVGGFRGVVTDRYCYGGCRYKVRFPTASMQPQWVAEYEIEAAP